MEYLYSNDANILAKDLKDFDKVAFEKFYKEKNIFITIQTYMQYLVYMDNIKTKTEILEKTKDVKIDVDLKFQKELEPIIKQSNIDIDILKKYYLLSIQTIGSSSIFYYYNEKEKELKENEKIN